MLHSIFLLCLSVIATQASTIYFATSDSSVSLGERTRPVVTSTIEKCVIRCQKYKTDPCIGFEYHWETKSCRIFSNISRVVQEKGSQVVYRYTGCNPKTSVVVSQLTPFPNRSYEMKLHCVECINGSRPNAGNNACIASNPVNLTALTNTPNVTDQTAPLPRPFTRAGTKSIPRPETRAGSNHLPPLHPPKPRQRLPLVAKTEEPAEKYSITYDLAE